MLSAADLDLVTRDPALPGLRVLLDDDALAAWLGAPVRRRYLRYKPGTTCVLGLDVAGRRAFVTAHTATAAAKSGKTAEKAAPDAVLAEDRERHLVAALPAADRDLPALAALTGPSRDRLLARLLPGQLAGAGLRLLSYKPQRRCVVLLQPPTGDAVVLRVHRPADTAASIRGARALAGGEPRTPEVLGTDRRRGLVAVSWLPGRGLDALLADGAGLPAAAAAGAALAALHRRPSAGLAVRGPNADGEAAQQAAGALAALLPALAGRAYGVAEQIGRSPAGAAVAAHGDFSADQVIVGPDGGVSLVDLDAAVAAEPALDLAGALAAGQASAVLGRGPDPAAWTAALRQGYAEVASLPPADRLETHLAAALLRRAAEPFRLCAPGWAEPAERMLSLAEQACRPGRGHEGAGMTVRA